MYHRNGAHLIERRLSREWVRKLADLYWQKQLNSKWNLHHEIQYRNYNTLGDLEQLLIRTGLGYDIGSKSNILLGYGISTPRILLKMPTIKPRWHHRIFQQFITYRLSVA